MKASARKRLLFMGLIERGAYDRYSKLTPAGLRALRDSGSQPKAENRSEAEG
jgi:hypothetical protein